MPFRKKRKKKVEYEKLGKGEAHWLRIENTDIVAMHLSEKKQVGVEGEVAAVPFGAKGKYEKGEIGSWMVFVKEEDAPLLPLEEWKRRTAETISATTSTRVTEQDVTLSTVTTPPWRPCPKCNSRIVDPKSKFCSNCGARL